MKNLGVEIDEDLHRALRIAAFDQGISLAELVRDALRKLVEFEGTVQR